MEHTGAEGGRAGGETALIYVLDAEFLRPLKVLQYSLHVHGSFAGCPIIVVTNDPVVRDDRFIRSIARDIEFMDDDHLRKFSTIRGDRIPTGLSTSFAPKFTFLKLAIFRPRGFYRHVFIDADMLCLNPVDEATLYAPQEFKAVREFGAGVFPIGAEPRPDGYPQTAFDYVDEYGEAVVTKIEGINSGFVCLQGRSISDDLMEQAIEIGSRKSFPNEQSLTTQIVRDRGFSYMRLPIWFNARRRLFASLGEDFFSAVRTKIMLMHYTPGKAWKMQRQGLRSWDRVWFDYEDRGTEWINDVASRMV
ncbi:hypothetical protein [Enterovirga rhinocerotis]|uniref:Lipopolysaccharide biosynthesis glycosyltransferase n=1 Tax=Enterovirga rhinocerotis TaxID=1339210 RepID=A0A4R7C5H1_9HYPH|nr:hypothetical protein [Enterovirga rhinocerotis]TDR93142.1 hypothetical protein EV668_0396 [Enterovirga rhinocerotis]